MTSSHLSTSVHSTDKLTVNLSHTDLYESTYSHTVYLHYPHHNIMHASTLVSYIHACIMYIVSRSLPFSNYVLISLTFKLVSHATTGSRRERLTVLISQGLELIYFTKIHINHSDVSFIPQLQLYCFTQKISPQLIQRW